MSDDLLDAIAVYRIVRFLQQDSLIEDQREYVINRWGGGYLRLGELLQCPWCLSIWVGAGVVLARTTAPRVWGMVARGLAFSAGAGVISELMARFGA